VDTKVAAVDTQAAVGVVDMKAAADATKLLSAASSSSLQDKRRSIPAPPFCFVQSISGRTAFKRPN
jgi:hypothetical protein